MYVPKNTAINFHKVQVTGDAGVIETREQEKSFACTSHSKTNQEDEKGVRVWES